MVYGKPDYQVFKHCYRRWILFSLEFSSEFKYAESTIISSKHKTAPFLNTTVNVKIPIKLINNIYFSFHSQRYRNSANKKDRLIGCWRQHVDRLTASRWFHRSLKFSTISIFLQQYVFELTFIKRLISGNLTVGWSPVHFYHNGQFRNLLLTRQLWMTYNIILKFISIRNETLYLIMLKFKSL